LKNLLIAALIGAVSVVGYNQHNISHVDAQVRQVYTLPAAASPTPTVTVSERPVHKHRQARVSRVRPNGVLTNNSVWDRLALCESGGNWRINTGNGFYGGIQFDLASWHDAGGVGYPHQASRAEQIKRGKIWKSRYGWKPWPACSRKLGLR
jgi:hypothetical protein